MKYDYITNATDKMLAKMLEPYARCEPHDEKKELILEICRRLRTYSNKPIPFNDEAFE